MPVAPDGLKLPVWLEVVRVFWSRVGGLRVLLGLGLFAGSFGSAFV